MCQHLKCGFVFYLYFWWMGHLYLSVGSFYTGIFSQAELIKREKAFEKIAERDRWKQEGLFSFPAWKSHYSWSSPLSVKSPPPLPYFPFLVPASLHHKPTLDDAMTNSSFSSIEPPPFSHWPIHCLIPAAAPSFSVSSPLLFRCLWSSLLVVHTNQLKTKEPLCLSHTEWALSLCFTLKKKTYCTKGNYCSSLKVQKQLLP